MGDNSQVSTCHPKGPPQPLGALLGVGLLQLHSAHPDDLTDQVNLLTVKILVPQILTTTETRRWREGGEERRDTGKGGRRKVWEIKEGERYKEGEKKNRKVESGHMT